MLPPRHITVLGGGITGLSSAFHLARRFPNALISIIEKQNRLGGWVRTERILLEKDGPLELTIEAGPRSLRPTSKAVLELINILNLKSALVTTSRASPTARSRFLYVPSLRSGLISIPSSPVAFLKSPLRKVILPAILREPLLKRNRPQSDNDQRDESLESFLSRRFGSNFARILGSALCHGVYAADARELSTRAAFPTLLDLEKRGGGSVVLGILKGVLGAKKRNKIDSNYKLGDLESLMRDVSVYSFQGGLQTLVDALEKALGAQTNIEISVGEGVHRIELRDDALVVHTSRRSLEPSHIVSALPLPSLHSALSESHAQPLPHLTTNTSSSVTVLSLIFDVPPHAIHPPGFGYLVPRPSRGYSSSSDVKAHDRLGVLGTVFDSSSLPMGSNENGERYTKLTVMLGGPYPQSLSNGENDDGDNLVNLVLAHLSDALQRPLPLPIESRLWRHVNCIPTLRVGHVERMEELQSVLQSSQGEGAWHGRMEVVGAGVGGVSVGDCVEAGRNVGAHWSS